MRPPERFMAGNLVWTASGDVWATWHLGTLPRPLTEIGSHSATVSVASLFKSIVGHEFILQGVLQWTDPIDVADRALRGVDLSTCPAWAVETDHLLDEVGEEALGERRWFLSVRLSGLDVDKKVVNRTRLKATCNKLVDMAGLSPLRPVPSSVNAWLAAAELLERNFPPELTPRPVSENENAWLRRYTQTRDEWNGIFDKPDQEQPSLVGAASLGTLSLDEGALTDLSKAEQSQMPKHLASRRWLKIVDDVTTCYQSTFVLSKLPKWMLWPSTQFIARIDQTGVPLDVTIRGVVRSRHAAQRKNARATTQLTDQIDQADGAEVNQRGLLLRLLNASDVLGEYTAMMEEFDHEVEVEPVIMATISARDTDTLESLADQFTSAPMMREFTWARPVGAQRAMFWAQRPSAGMNPHVRDYRQLTRSEVFASALPLTAHQLGRSHGIPMALNTSSPLQSMVYLDLVADTRDGDSSASPTIATVGEQGSGKSMFQKRLCGAIVARGGRMIATDNSSEKEWIRFVEALDCPVGIVDAADPRTSIDPLRVLPPHLAGSVTQSFLITLLDVTATDPLGQTIAKALKPAYLTTHAISSIGSLQAHLSNPTCALAGAEEVASRIGVFSDLEQDFSLARAVFDENLPPLDVEARAIVVGTSNIELPGEAELTTQHLFRQMGVEKIFGRAFYALVGRLAKELCFSDRSDPAIFNVDEAHHMTTSPEATQVLKDFIRFGRRELAPLSIGTHDPEGDIQDSTVRGLIKHRVVLHLADPNLAKAGARFLGIDEDKSPEEFAELTRQIMTFSGPGAGLYRDRWGRVGEVQLLRPATPALRAAANTTPPAKQVGV